MLPARRVEWGGVWPRRLSRPQCEPFAILAQFPTTKNFPRVGKKQLDMYQTSNLLFPGPAKKAIGHVSDFQFAFSRAGKKQNGSDFQFAFSRAWKRQKAQTSNLLFPGPGKSKRLRVPICFFPGREKAKGSDFQFAFFRAGKKQNGSDFQFAFSRPAQSSNLLFPGPGKSKMVQTSNLLFPGPGKSKMYQACSLESGLETSSACGIRARNLLLMSLAPYPLGHNSLI